MTFNQSHSSVHILSNAVVFKHIYTVFTTLIRGCSGALVLEFHVSIRSFETLGRHKTTLPEPLRINKVL